LIALALKRRLRSESLATGHLCEDYFRFPNVEGDGTLD